MELEMRSDRETTSVEDIIALLEKVYFAALL